MLLTSFLRLLNACVGGKMKYSIYALCAFILIWWTSVYLDNVEKALERSRVKSECITDLKRQIAGTGMGICEIDAMHEICPCANLGEL